MLSNNIYAMTYIQAVYKNDIVTQNVNDTNK